jgi:hypothetical protein
MAECRWLKPVLVAQFEFVEWTADAYLRHHSRFVALREDKKAKDVRREGGRWRATIAKALSNPFCEENLQTICPDTKMKSRRKPQFSGPPLIRQ